MEEIKTREKETSSETFYMRSKRQRWFTFLSALSHHVGAEWRRRVCRKQKDRKNRTSPGCPSVSCLHNDMERVYTKNCQTDNTTKNT